MKDRLLNEMEAYFGDDAKRIAHAHSVLRYAQQILKNETADVDIVEAAAILHDIGIHAAENKYGSTAGKYQQIEGPPIAREILLKLDFQKEKLNKILEIIAHHHTPGVIKTTEFNVLYDADWLVNLPDEFDISDKEKTKKMIKKVFLTKTGNKVASTLYLS